MGGSENVGESGEEGDSVLEESVVHFCRLAVGEIWVPFSFSSIASWECFVAEGCKGESLRSLEVPKRIGRDDGEDFRDGWTEDEFEFLIEEVKVIFWTIPYAVQI